MRSEWRFLLECEHCRILLKEKRFYHLLQIGLVCVGICSRCYEAPTGALLYFVTSKSCQFSVVARSSGQTVAYVGSHLMRAEYFTEWAYGVYWLSEMRDQLFRMNFRSSRAAPPGTTAHPYKSLLCSDLKGLLIWALASFAVVFLITSHFTSLRL